MIGICFAQWIGHRNESSWSTLLLLLLLHELYVGLDTLFRAPKVLSSNVRPWNRLAGDASWRCRCSFTFATDYQTAMFTMIYDGLEAAREAVHLCYKQPVVNTNAYVYWSTYNCRCHIFPLHIFHLDQRLFVFLHGEYTITSSFQRRDYRWNRCNDWLPWQSDCTQWV